MATGIIKAKYPYSTIDFEYKNGASYNSFHALKVGRTAHLNGRLNFSPTTTWSEIMTITNAKDRPVYDIRSSFDVIEYYVTAGGSVQVRISPNFSAISTSTIDLDIEYICAN